MRRIRDWAHRGWAGTKVVVTAWPTWAAGIAAVVTGLTVHVVPELHGPWATKALAVLTAVGVVVRVVTHVVAILTPVLFPENRGLLAPPPAQSPGPSIAARHVLDGLGPQDRLRNVRVRTWEPGDKDPLPPVGPEAYPPGSERLPHRRRV